MLQVCNLTPECMADDDDDRKGWAAMQFEGRWQKNISAGGCRNFPGKKSNKWIKIKKQKNKAGYTATKVACG